jgi:hypothetical protein
LEEAVSQNYELLDSFLESEASAPLFRGYITFGLSNLVSNPSHRACFTKGILKRREATHLEMAGIMILQELLF